MRWLGHADAGKCLEQLDRKTDNHDLTHCENAAQSSPVFKKRGHRLIDSR
jgi:hypothetical protein